jgi:hypothetical protein
MLQQQVVEQVRTGALRNAEDEQRLRHAAQHLITTKGRPDDRAGPSSWR